MLPFLDLKISDTFQTYRRRLSNRFSAGVRSIQHLLLVDISVQEWSWGPINFFWNPNAIFVVFRFPLRIFFLFVFLVFLALHTFCIQSHTRDIFDFLLTCLNYINYFKYCYYNYVIRTRYTVFSNLCNTRTLWFLELILFTKRNFVFVSLTKMSEELNFSS